MRFNHKFKLPAKKLAMLPSENVRVQAHFKDEVDINNIVAKYRKTGVITHVRRAKELYGDFTAVPDFAEAMDTVARARAQFELLPAELRNRFKNSIVGFQEFIANEKNYDECVALGIYEPKKETPPDQVLETLKEVAKNTAPKKKPDSE